MLERIFKLLERHFYVKENLVYLSDTDEKVTPENIAKSIRDIYGIPNYLACYIIERWYESKGLNTYRLFFKPSFEFDLILPVAMRVAAQTIGLDLVSIQPLSAPMGRLHFFGDSSSKPVKPTQISFIKRVKNQVHKWIKNWFGRFKAKPVPPVPVEITFSERDNNVIHQHRLDWVERTNNHLVPHSTTQLNMREIREQTIRKWSESGLLDGLKGHHKSNIALLFESQNQQLINEIKEDKFYNLEEEPNGI